MKAVKLITSLSIALAVTFMGCDKGSENPTGLGNNQTRNIQNGNTSCFPKSIVALIDKSKSTPGHNMPQPTIEDFQPLIKHICDCIGSLAVGLITASSDKVFVTLRVFNKEPQKPVEPNKDLYPNDFDYRDAYKVYQKDMSLYDVRVTEWKNDVESKANIFEPELVRLFEHPVNAMKTDIHRALNKSEVYHSNYPGFKPFTLIISDGKDDVVARLSDMNTGAEVFLVYGSDIPTGKWVKKYNYTVKADLETAIRSIIREKIAENGDHSNFEKK